MDKRLLRSKTQKDMELKYGEEEFVKYSSQEVKLKTTGVTLNGVSHTLQLRDYGNIGFEIVIKGGKTCYYLQIDPSKKFEGLGSKKKQNDLYSFTDYIDPYSSTPKVQEKEDRFLNTSQSSLFQLFEDTFFGHNNDDYTTYEFLVEDTEKKEDIYSFMKEKSYKSANAKRRKTSDLDILYLRINVKLPSNVSHLVNDFSYFFTFLSMPNINTSELPDEIFINLFQFLGTEFLLVKISTVCKRFHNIVSSEYMGKIIFLRMFPGIANKPDPGKTWKQNIIEKYCSSIRWETVMPKFGEENPHPIEEREFFERIGGSPTRANLGRYCEDGNMVFWTNCYVSPSSSHEWKVRFKHINQKSQWYGSSIIGIKKESWKVSSMDVIPDHSPEYQNFDRNIYGLDLGSGLIFYEGEKKAYTEGGYHRSMEQYGEYDRREREDFNLFKDGEIVTMTLSNGNLEFEFGEGNMMKKVSCNTDDLSQRYCLCVRCAGLYAEIVSFKKIQ